MIILKGINYDEMSKKAANILMAQILLKPDCVLGLATGSTPIGIYEHLVKSYTMGDLDFFNVISVNLDEYKGLGPEDPQSYRYFMQKHLFSKVNIHPNHTFLPDGTNLDSQKACKEYDEVLRSTGGVDIQLLGLGHNGHIGFNEPGDSFPLNTHCVNLTPSTIEANTRFFASPDLVPREAYTMGIGSIMQAKKIVVVVSGADKAAILNQVINGPITSQVPASILQLHRDVTIVADIDALSML